MNDKEKFYLGMAIFALGAMLLLPVDAPFVARLIVYLPVALFSLMLVLFSDNRDK